MVQNRDIVATQC